MDENAAVNYENIKMFAIERLFVKINLELEIVDRMLKCDNSYDEPNESFSHNVFSWSMADFLIRRQLHDFVWTDVMQRMSDNCLMVYKFRQDIRQLQGYLKRIFKGFKDFDNIEDLIKHPIRSAKAVLVITQTVDQQYAEKSKIFSDLNRKQIFLANIKRQSYQHMYKIYMETKLSNSMIWNPIELRYQMGWYNSKVCQVKHHHDMNLLKQQKDIADTVNKIVIENNVSGSSIDFLYISLGDIKIQLDKLNTKLDEETERFDSRIGYTKSRIGKTIDKWNYKKEEIVRMNEEIQIVLRKQAQEAAEKERCRLEAEGALVKKRSSVRIIKGVSKPGSPKSTTDKGKTVDPKNQLKGKIKNKK